MERLGIHDVAGLVRYAMRVGLVPPEEAARGPGGRRLRFFSLSIQVLPSGACAHAAPEWLKKCSDEMSQLGSRSGAPGAPITVVGHELILSLFSCSSTVVDVSAIKREEMT